MESSKFKVTYVSSSCGDKDELDNHPHESVAESLCDLLQNHKEIKHPVIGLEGAWGSGKSQVINILKKKIDAKGKDFCFITYDIWSAQEDLTRRSFLDAVLNETKSKTEFFEVKRLEEDYKLINATNIIRSKRTFPVIRMFYIWIMLIPLVSGLMKSIERVFGYCPNAPLTYSQFIDISTFAFVFLAVISLCYSFTIEWRRLSEEKDLKEPMNIFEKFVCVLGRVLYFIQKADSETKDYETVLKDEPSVSRFQTIFDHVKDSIKPGKTLVIVFDNMDRLNNRAKLMNSWTLLHTFFTEQDYDGKIWALVPYAKQQLIQLVEGENKNENENENIADKTTEFINKTFFTSFRIPEPIMTSWKSFLNQKLDEAFSPNLDVEDKTVVALIFSRYMKGKPIRPRDIIAYVNKIVTLYSQHYFEEISVKYIALYAQYEKLFSDPLNVILNFKGLDSLVPLFDDRRGLSAALASIYYNLPSEKALEVAFDKKITAFLQSDYEVLGDNDEKKESYDEIASNGVFFGYVNEYFNNDVDYPNLKMENLFYLLDQEKISLSTRHKIVENIAKNIENLKDQFACYEGWMESTFLHYCKKDINVLIKTLINESRGDFECYYRTIIPLLKIKEERNDISVELSQYNLESVPNIIDFVSYLKEEKSETYFQKSKIRINVPKLNEYIKSDSTGYELFSPKVDDLYEVLLFLRKQRVDMSEIASDIIGADIPIRNLRVDQVRRIYKVFNIVIPHIDKVPSYTDVSSYGSEFLVIPEYLACVIKKLVMESASTSYVNSALEGNLLEESKPVCGFILNYVSFDQLLEMAVDSENVLLKQLIQGLISDYAFDIETTGYLLSNTSQIMEKVLETNEEKVLSLLDKSTNDIFKECTLDYLSVDKYWFENISETSIQEHPFYNKLYEKWKEEMESFTKEKWIDIFESKNVELEGNVSLLEEKKLLPDGFWSGSEIEVAIKESFRGYIKGVNKFDNNLFRIWNSYAGSSVKAELVNYVIDSIKNPSAITIDKLSEIMRLYVPHSKRWLDSKYAESFFDEYFSRFIRETPIESLSLFVDANWEGIYQYYLLLKKDRGERVIMQMSNRLGEIPKDVAAFENWKGHIESLQKSEKN